MNGIPINMRIAAYMLCTLLCILSHSTHAKEDDAAALQSAAAPLSDVDVEALVREVLKESGVMVAHDEQAVKDFSIFISETARDLETLQASSNLSDQEMHNMLVSMIWQRRENAEERAKSLTQSALRFAEEWFSHLDNRHFDVAYDEFAESTKRSISKEEWTSAASDIMDYFGEQKHHEVELILLTPNLYNLEVFVATLERRNNLHDGSELTDELILEYRNEAWAVSVYHPSQ